jgi:hypothetical protein
MVSITAGPIDGRDLSSSSTDYLAYNGSVQNNFNIQHFARFSCTPPDIITFTAKTYSSNSKKPQTFYVPFTISNTDKTKT